MSVSVERLDGSVILMVIEGDWSVDEWLAGYQQAHDLIGEGGLPAHLVFEHREAKAPTRVIGNLPKLAAAQKANEATEAMIISTLVVGQKGFLRRISEIFMKTYRTTTIHFTETLDEAREIIERERTEARH